MIRTSLAPRLGTMTKKPKTRPCCFEQSAFIVFGKSLGTFLTGGGVVLSFMGSRETQEMAAWLVRRAKDCIVMTAYTMDLLFLCNE